MLAGRLACLEEQLAALTKGLGQQKGFDDGPEAVEPELPCDGNVLGACVRQDGQLNPTIELGANSPMCQNPVKTVALDDDLEARCLRAQEKLAQNELEKNELEMAIKQIQDLDAEEPW